MGYLFVFFYFWREISMAEKFYSKNFVKVLLLADILKNSSYDSPKNANQIVSELPTRLDEIFPDSLEDNKITATTIVRHVQDMNRSKCFDIRTHKNKKYGYYNATKFNNGNNVVFTSGEFAIIATILQRISSISEGETQEILSKFENLVDTLGESFNYFLKRQNKHLKKELRKTKRDTLPTVYEISRAIVEERKIQFKLYDPNYSYSPDSVPKFQKIR
jgi:enamine deaminase RidA (YjgF/YER057c/UK114 family)